MQHHYYLVYKPFGMLSQFTKEGNHATLADLFNFPKDVYPVGRLDADSEGLLILTNDKTWNDKLLNPKHAHEREYWVQVEGEPTDKDLQQLIKGVDIKVNKKNFQATAVAAKVIAEPTLPPRNPPIRYRKNVPDTWIKLILTQGKNRQVRRMTAKIGFPTLRLVRYRIGRWTIDGLQPGDVRELEP